MSNKAKKGSLSDAARVLGEKGGQSTSPSKQRAAKVNGKKGGRPQGSTDKK